jgi:hypothetical protein
MIQFRKEKETSKRMEASNYQQHFTAMVQFMKEKESAKAQESSKRMEGVGRPPPAR